MENGPFEDVFPIKHGDIPASYASLPEGRCGKFGLNQPPNIICWIVISSNISIFELMIFYETAHLSPKKLLQLHGDG